MRPRVYVLARKGLTQNTRIFKQARSLTDAGAEVVLLGVRIGAVAAHERRDGFEIVRMPLRTPPPPAEGGPLALVARLLRPLTFLTAGWGFWRRSVAEVERRGPPTVVHANDLDTLHAAFAIARRHKVPIVYDAQELYPGIHAFPGWFQALLRAYERVLIRRVDRVIAVNPDIADRMERDYGRPIDAVVLNSAPLEPDAPAAGGGLRDDPRVRAGEPVFVYSGGLTSERGIENTVLALRHLDRGVLVIVGEGPLEPDLRALADEHRLGDRVVFTGFVPHTEVPALIGSADVGVLPYENVGLNHWLASPSKLFHYIQAELPIAASDFPFLRRVVAGEGLGATFDPASPESIAAALERILADPEEYAATKERLRAAKRRYCWEREEERFLAVYRSLGVLPNIAT